MPPDETRSKMRTYKLSVMGVEVQGLCVSLYRGMDFIRWYMGGHAIRACRVCEAEVKEHGNAARKGLNTAFSSRSRLKFSRFSIGLLLKLSRPDRTAQDQVKHRLKNTQNLSSKRLKTKS